MSARGGSKPMLAILDCNTWMAIILGQEPRLATKIIKEGHPVRVTSYGIAEIIRVLKRLAPVNGVPFQDLERRAWNLFGLPTITKEFTTAVSDSILQSVKRAPEYRVIAKLLSMEVKDVPYVVSAFTTKAIIVTLDERSFLSRAKLIKQHLGVDVIGLRAFLGDVTGSPVASGRPR